MISKHNQKSKKQIALILKNRKLAKAQNKTERKVITETVSFKKIEKLKQNTNKAKQFINKFKGLLVFEIRNEKKKVDGS